MRNSYTAQQPPGVVVKPKYDKYKVLSTMSSDMININKH